VAVPHTRSGCCFPSYEAIAGSTVAEALKALEWAGVLTRPGSASAALIYSAASAGNGACIAAAMPTRSMTRNSTLKGPPPISPKISSEHRTKRCSVLYKHYANPTAHSNVRLPDSPQLLQQGRASNKAP